MTHPAPNEKTRPSVAAVCASMNADNSAYKAQVKVQGHRMEMITDLREMVK